MGYLHCVNLHLKNITRFIIKELLYQEMHLLFNQLINRLFAYRVYKQ